MAGVYLAEFGRESRFAAAVRMATNILMGVPSIIIGVFVYTLLVATHGTFLRVRRGRGAGASSCCR